MDELTWRQKKKKRRIKNGWRVGWIDDGQMVRWMHELTKIEGQM